MKKDENKIIPPLDEENGKYYRFCPRCDSKIYSSNKYNCTRAIKTKRVCRSCSGTLSMTEERKEQFTTYLKNKIYTEEDRRKISERVRGEKNPYYGKSPTPEQRKKASESRKGIKQTGKQLEESRRTIKIAQQARAAKGNRSFYESWVEKYGKEGADRLMKDFKERQSKNSAGKNNPMYGKPAPHGSGNGWKCWYKSIYFRSLREVIFYIDEVEKNGLSYMDCHASQKYKIPYKDHEGTDRNYYPDFLVDGRLLVECKPKKLWNTPTVQSKTLAATKFCEENGLSYWLYDCNLDDFAHILVAKYKSGELVFDKRYEDKFKKYHEIE